MMRVSTIFFCILLAAAAAGRYRAEAGMRADRQILEELKSENKHVAHEINQLKLDVKVLESAPRIAKLAKQNTSLAPVKPEQMHSAAGFIALIEDTPAREEKQERPLDEQFIINAIAMADFATGQ